MMKNYKFLFLLLPLAYFILGNEGHVPSKLNSKSALNKRNHKPPMIYSHPTSVKQTEKVPRIFGRKVRGRRGVKISKNIIMVNKFNPQWKNSLKKYLLKFQNPSVAVNIKVDESYIMVDKNQARLIEEVIINYTEKGEYLSSFRAIVDSENGQILETFDKATIQERRKAYPRLSPTGAIRNPPARRRK